jgi:hypothetical protein
MAKVTVWAGRTVVNLVLRSLPKAFPFGAQDSAAFVIFAKDGFLGFHPEGESERPYQAAVFIDGVAADRPQSVQCGRNPIAATSFKGDMGYRSYFR